MHLLGKKFASQPQRQPAFIEPMECLAVTKLPDGPEWVFEIKFDGYRAIAIKSDGKLNLVSRRRNSFNIQYPLVLKALGDLPDETVIDGEVVALDEAGRPAFNLLQHFRAEASRIHYFVFDLLVYNNRDLTRLPFIERRQILNSVLKFGSPRIRIAEYFETSAENMLNAARGQRLEGVIAKRRDSTYQAGQRSGSWVKYRLNSGQELVIGGVYAWDIRPGFNHCWLLPRGGVDLRSARPKRLCSDFAAPGVPEATPSADAELSLCESSRNSQRALGRRLDCQGYGELCLGPP